MSDEQTKNLDPRSFEERLFNELGSMRKQFSKLETRMAALEMRIGALEKRMDAIEERLTSLEERVDRRLLETRPMWEALQATMTRLDEKVGLMGRDLYDIRSDVSAHDKWLKEHERRLNS